MQNNSISKDQNSINQCKSENDVLKSMRWYMTKKEDEIFGILSQFDKEYIKENRDLLKKATQGEFLSDEEKIQLEEFIEASLSYTEMKDYIKEQVQEVEWKSTGINSSGNEWFKEFWTDQEGELTTDKVEKVDIYGYDTFMEFVKKYNIEQYMDMKYEDFVNLKSLEFVEVYPTYEDLNKLKILEFIEEIKLEHYDDDQLPESLKNNIKLKKIHIDSCYKLSYSELNGIKGLKFAKDVFLGNLRKINKIPNVLQNNSNLERIELYMFESLEGLDTFKGLEFAKHIIFDEVGLEKIPETLKNNTNLDSLIITPPEDGEYILEIPDKKWDEANCLEFVKKHIGISTTKLRHIPIPLKNNNKLESCSIRGYDNEAYNDIKNNYPNYMKELDKINGFNNK